MQLVAIRRRQIATVDPLQATHHLDCFFGEGRLALEAVKDNALEQIAQGQLTVLRKALEDLKERFLDTDPSLCPLYQSFGDVVTPISIKLPW